MEGVWSLLLILGTCACRGAVLPSPNYTPSATLDSESVSSSSVTDREAIVADDINFAKTAFLDNRGFAKYGEALVRSHVRPTNQERREFGEGGQSPHRIRPLKVSKSSSSLSGRHVDLMLQLLEELEEGEGERGEGGSAILTTDIYQGKKTLVYKLAPGASIFGGKVKKAPAESSADPTREYQDRVDSNSVVYADITGPGNPAHPPTTALRPPFRVPVVRRPFQPRPPPPPPPLGPPTEPIGDSTSWKVHYMKPPPPLSSMDNPYLSAHRQPPRGPGKPRVPFMLMNRKPALEFKPTLTEALFYPLGKAIQVARSKARGAWVSFLLLHYLGFVPPVPGVPRHQDPDDANFSFMNMLSSFL